MNITNFELIEMIRTTEASATLKVHAIKELLRRIKDCDESREEDKKVHKDMRF